MNLQRYGDILCNLMKCRLSSKRKLFQENLQQNSGLNCQNEILDKKR